jgi:hypothetical protein
MNQDTAPQESMTELLIRLGVPVTAEGKARARQKLAGAEARRDLPARAAFLEQLRQGNASPA